MGILTTLLMIVSLLLVLGMMFVGFKGIAGSRHKPQDEAPGERTIFRRSRKQRLERSAPQPEKNEPPDSQRAA